MDNIMFYEDHKWLWFQLLLLYADGICRLDKKKIQEDFIWMLENHPNLTKSVKAKSGGKPIW